MRLHFDVRVSSVKWEMRLHFDVRISIAKWELRLYFGVRIFSMTKSCVSTPNEVCVFSMNKSRVSVTNEVCILSAWKLCLYGKQETRLHFRWGPRLQFNVTFVSTRAVFSLYFSSQFNSTLAKIVDDFSRFNSTPTTSSEYQWGLDCVPRHSRWSSLVASKSLTVHSRRLGSRQDEAQGISEDC